MKPTESVDVTRKRKICFFFCKYVFVFIGSLEMVSAYQIVCLRRARTNRNTQHDTASTFTNGEIKELLHRLGYCSVTGLKSNRSVTSKTGHSLNTLR
jgi:hypothetical protein